MKKWSCEPKIDFKVSDEHQISNAHVFLYKHQPYADIFHNEPKRKIIINRYYQGLCASFQC